jgi:hypothetical protein
MTLNSDPSTAIAEWGTSTNKFARHMLVGEPIAYQLEAKISIHCCRKEPMVYFG